MEKDHLEILLEDIQTKFELFLEGHEALRNEIREARKESNERHEHTASLIQALNKKIDGVASELAQHRTDTEIHRKGYSVSEHEH